MGQFIAYRSALQQQDPERILYLAAPENLYKKFFATSFIQQLLRENEIYLVTYDIDQEELIQWIPSPNTVNT